METPAYKFYFYISSEYKLKRDSGAFVVFKPLKTAQDTAWKAQNHDYLAFFGGIVVIIGSNITNLAREYSNNIF